MACERRRWFRVRMGRSRRIAPVLGLLAVLVALPASPARSAPAPLPPPGTPVVPGHPDAAWGGDGQVDLDLGDTLAAFAVHAAPASADRRLVATAGSHGIFVQRLLSDGSDDPTWGGGEAVRLPDPEFASVGQDPIVAERPGGGALVAWSQSLCGVCLAMRVTALTPSGTIDDRWGDSGSATAIGRGPALAAAPLADGSLVLLGASGAVSRLDPTGTPDSTFGNSGVTYLGDPDAANRWFTDVVARPGGGFAVLGWETDLLRAGTAVVHQLDAAGRLVAAYGTGGTARVHAGEVVATGGLLVDGDGLLVGVTTGTAVPPGEHPIGRASVVRLGPSGAVDATWGGADGLDVTVAGDGATVDLERVGDGVLVAEAVGPGLRGTGAAVVSVAADGSARRWTWGPDLGGPVRVEGLVGDALVLGVEGGAGRRGFLLPGVDGPTVAPDPIEVGAAHDAGEAPGGVLVRADGAVVVVGSLVDDALVVAIRADGSRDPSFGDQGVVHWRNGLADRIELTDVVALADGRLVVVGREDGEDRVRVARVRADGSLDPTFGSGGQAATSAGSGTTQPRVAVDGRGRVLVSTRLGVARFTAAGQPDATFGTGGEVDIPGEVGIGDVGVRSGGYVLVGTRPISDVAFEAVAMALVGDGRLDPSFGTGGTTPLPGPVSTSPPTAAQDLTVRSDGRVVVEGSGQSGPFLVRLGADGTLDATFGVGGVATREAPGPSASAPAAGSVILPITYNGGLTLQRYAADGTFDDRYSTYARPGPELGQWSPSAVAGDDGNGRAAAVVAVRDVAYRSLLRVARYVGGELATKPTVSIGDTSVVEGTDTSSALRFPVVLSAPSAVPVTARFILSPGGTADAFFDRPVGSYFFAVVTIAPGQGRGELIVPVLADGDDEPDETFVFEGGPAQGFPTIEYGVPGDLRATGTIIDDDGWQGTVPPAPPGVAVTAGRGHVTATWYAPPPGHSATRYYSVLVVQDGAITGWRFFPADARAGSVDDLRDDRPADVFVQAWTGAGFGPPSGPHRVTPTAAGAPVVPAAAPGAWVFHDEGFVTVGLGSPPADGGSPIVAYSVVVADAAGQVVGWRNVAPDTATISFPDLPRTHRYDVHVAAVTSVGFGAFTQQPATIRNGTVQPVAPPAWEEAVAGARSVTAYWGQSPEQGTPVLGYSVVAVQDGAVAAWQNVGPEARSVVLRGLRPGVPTDVVILPFGRDGWGHTAATPERVTPTA